MNSDSDTVRYFIEFFYEDQFPWSTSMNAFKCIQCGEIVDKVIIENRTLMKAEKIAGANESEA